MMSDGERLSIEVTRDELELIRAALRMLLRSEDDPGTIESLKALLPRIEMSTAASAHAPAAPAPAPAPATVPASTTGMDEEDDPA